MLNRKANKPSNGAGNHARGNPRPARAKTPLNRRRFIISPKAPPPRVQAPLKPLKNGSAKATPPITTPGKPTSASQAKAAYASSHGTPTPGAPGQAVDLTETIKTLLH